MIDKKDFEAQILAYLDACGFVRYTGLYEYYKTTITGGGIGSSKPSFDRKLRRLIRENRIRKVSKKELETTFGVIEKDNRASYFMSIRASQTKKHLDKVFTLVTSADSVQQKMALKEIAGYDYFYTLTPKQLDTLVGLLDTTDVELAAKVLAQMYVQFKKGVFPKNEAVFVKNLRTLLTRFPVPNHRHTNFRTDLITLLGHYKDPIVIKQLTEDMLKADNLDAIKNDYSHEYTAELIDDHRTELFRLQKKLAKQGKEDRATFLSQLRFNALGILNPNARSWHNLFKQDEENK